MRFHMRRVAALCLTLLLLLVMLAACGDGDTEETPATDDTAATPTVEATTASPATPEPGSTESPSAATQEASPTQPAAAATQPASTATTESPATTPTAEPPVESMFAYGWNVAFRGDENGTEHNARTIEVVKDSGFQWVRFQLEWQQFERQPGSWDPLPMDRMINQASEAGLKILIVVTKAPEWALDPSGQQFLRDFNDFEELMAFVADRYRGKVQAWEVWNEQNLAHEMHGFVRVSDYFEILRAGHDGIRQGDPDALVVFGGLTPNGVNDPTIAIDDLRYLQEIYAYQNGAIKEYFDILGVHLNSTHNPPDTMWPDNPSDEQGWNEDPSFYFRRAEQLREVMIEHDDEDTMMWITEFGWTTANQAPGYEYGVNNSEEDVAEYLTRALEIATHEWDFVSGAFVWNLNWSTLASPEQEIYPWSALNGDWSPRPAYEALKEMEKH